MKGYCGVCGINLNAIEEKCPFCATEYAIRKTDNDRLQKLIDICFELVLTSTKHEWFKDKTNEEIAKWVSEQLRQLGFDTEPCGSNRGVLK